MAAPHIVSQVYREINAWQMIYKKNLNKYNSKQQQQPFYLNKKRKNGTALKNIEM
ncbi:hypothetical protein [Paracnuella aquatica]|uniref:hypothetical protein n=1 Tax=Paracnuella aquatica TaxID=2268757 RepID=UPI0012D7A071|nr:hypothetical protein [Paracnuella aquatica]